MDGLIIAAVTGAIIFAATLIWIIVIAFKEAIRSGLLSMFVPFYALYYAISRWTKTKKPFVIGLIGVALFAGGIVLVQFELEIRSVIARIREPSEVEFPPHQVSYKCGLVERQLSSRW
jgi:thiol:disulfide interchange protein